ncbi:related to flavoprotein involved in K+ transport [Phialocephala subalpina]|uniref:Related to flavoprotein involved in K+ transport n=1 Tax=Phialocephala subalpina TaxID=576137 RepID=A0A1L7XXF3_9HELO|nr:related to flavoprotein involved in K+ transport [Phialocephala subalpina]
MTITTEPQYLDALVVGAGFGGIYQLKKLLDQGLNVMGIDMADDVGGTWYWNRYPGAMSEYSWDHEDLVSYPWSHHYLQGPEILSYLKHIVKKYDLRKHFQFETELLAAQWNEEERRWIVTLSTMQVFKVKYLVTALGLLSKTNFPAFPGLDKFAGELYHTARWPENADLKGKRVGVIGNGSTGVQLITALAKSEELKQLLSFQRSPQFSVPAGNGPVSTQHRKHLNETYDQVWDQANNSLFAFGFDEELNRTVASVSPEERERIFEEAWRQGNGFRFMFWTFSDITVNEEANIAASDFIKKKICQTVKDPEKARKLCPTEWYARRPLCDSGYYEQFNRENVDIVDIKANPITELTAAGIKTADGKLYQLDVIICATGFDAVDGNYTRIAIQGRNGETLKDHWSKVGPTSYLGFSVPNFPNLFLITGPNGPFSNLPPAIECHVEIITDLIARAEKNELPKAANGVNGHTNGHAKIHTNGIVEALPEAEQEWTALCDELSSKSLFRRIDSWIFGKNVPGKKATTMFFFAGLGPYRKTVKEILDDDLRGFKRF